MARSIGILAGVLWSPVALGYAAIWLLSSFGSGECAGGSGVLEVTAVPIGFRCFDRVYGTYDGQPDRWEIVAQLLLVVVPIAAWLLVGRLDRAERERWRYELGRQYVGVGLLIALGSAFTVLGDGSYNRPAGSAMFALGATGAVASAVWLRRHPVTSDS